MVDPVKDVQGRLVVTGAREGDCWVVRVEGESDLATEAELARQLDELVERGAGAPLVLDLSGLVFASVASVRMLAALSVGRPSCVVVAVPVVVQRVWRILGFALPVERATVADAVRDTSRVIDLRDVVPVQRSGR